DTDPARLAQAMVGDAHAAEAETRRAHRPLPVVAARDARAALEVQQLQVMGDRGTLAVQGLSLSVRPGEILGVAGVSGNGQRELVEALVGQRPRVAGTVRVVGEPYLARRSENRVLQLRALPEEPLRNACVGE